MIAEERVAWILLAVLGLLMSVFKNLFKMFHRGLAPSPNWQRTGADRQIRQNRTLIFGSSASPASRREGARMIFVPLNWSNSVRSGRFFAPGLKTKPSPNSLSNVPEP